jgi:flavodoxin
MKVLVTYFSQTGNTEKVAKAIAGAAGEAELKLIGDVADGSISDYDLIFVGAPIHAGGLAADAKKLLDSISDSSKLALAGFITHAADVYESANFEKGLETFEEICNKKGINYLGVFNCTGKLNEKIRPMVQQMKGVSDEDWAAQMEETDKHPNDEDLKNAGKFAAEMMDKAK